MAIINSYSIANVNLQIECEDSRLTERIIGAIDDYFTKNDSVLNPHNIFLRFKNNDFSFKAPETAQELFVSSSLRVLKDGDFCYLISGDSLFQLDLKNSTGIGSLDSNFWRSPLKCKQDFLMLSILWLIRPHGLYALHANGLVKAVRPFDNSTLRLGSGLTAQGSAQNEVGVLIVGNSGSGKSTLALSLIRQGWGYLSDDVTLISENLDGIEAIAFLKGFSFDSNLANRYPELNKPSSFNGQKRFLDINSIYPDGFLPCCLPRILIFPKIASRGKSQIIPIDRAKALILLAENSGGIMVDKKMVIKQMEVLRRLVYQTASYQLLAGRDLYERPEKILEILDI
jgi:hypothetical protein